MPAKVIVLPIWLSKEFENRGNGTAVVSTVARTPYWQGLSPFFLGPCKLYSGYTAKRMENAWQFSKVYREHMSDGHVTDAYWEWAETGWADSKAHRYPMGKGRKPQFSLWNDQQLGYIEARKQIYAPLYAEAVQKTEAWDKLKHLYKTKEELVLLDFDAYEHRKLSMTLTEVLNNPDRKMGHAFVLAMLLTRDKALKQVELRE